MGKTLGLDIGENSIGWALLENNKIADYGVQIFETKPNELKKNSNKIETIKLTFRQNYQLICLSVLTLCLFGMAIATPNFWQFWINLGIGGIIAILTTLKK
ncbi:hypothetical protein [Formosa maritima]|uniref:Uncharacterized protein n=1 Tax=Formosa maritima TaxID=2592046 RepID=A0A5D0G279_9FLAO|nr:hypothetical protein [Formosa maritima]TYA52751.1 hypothetical protein FVF61_11985 [Formosa maritima]